jgi:hypothetical protein
MSEQRVVRDLWEADAVLMGLVFHQPGFETRRAIVAVIAPYALINGGRGMARMAEKTGGDTIMPTNRAQRSRRRCTGSEAVTAFTIRRPKENREATEAFGSNSHPRLSSATLGRLFTLAAVIGWSDDLDRLDPVRTMLSSMGTPDSKITLHKSGTRPRQRPDKSWTKAGQTTRNAGRPN